MIGGRPVGKLRWVPPSEEAAAPAAPADDQALLAAAARRDPVAMGVLFDQHHRPLHRFLSRLAGSSRDIDDLVNATFLEAFRSCAGFRAGSCARTWLFGIAVNISRHHVRGEVRRRAAMRGLQLHPRGESARPDQSAERRQLLERLAVTLAELPHERRAAFLLCDVEELSGNEAAEALGAPPGTVGRWLHEARTVLRAALKEPTP